MHSSRSGLYGVLLALNQDGIEVALLVEADALLVFGALIADLSAVAVSVLLAPA